MPYCMVSAATYQPTIGLSKDNSGSSKTIILP